MAQRVDFTWHQGEDFPISLIYRSGPTGSETPVDLTLYSLRMDIAGPNGKVLTVLNDDAIPDTDPFTTGSQPDNTFEAVLGSDGSILVTLSRALTLPGGVMYQYITANPPILNFNYDIFLRNSANKQTKLIYGDITMVKGVTKWL